MPITVSLILDFGLCALLAVQGMVPISAAASEGEFAALPLSPSCSLQSLVGFQPLLHEFPPRPLSQKCLKS